MAYLENQASMYGFFITLTVMRQSRFCANISATMENGAFVFFGLIDDFNFLFGPLIPLKRAIKRQVFAFCLTFRLTQW